MIFCFLIVDSQWIRDYNPILHRCQLRPWYRHSLGRSYRGWSDQSSFGVTWQQGKRAMNTLIGTRNGEAYLGKNGSCSDFADYDSSAMWCHIFWILALSDSRITHFPVFSDVLIIVCLL